MSRQIEAWFGVAVMAALAFAALIPIVRLPLLVMLVIGVWLLPVRQKARWALAAATPVALILVWGDVVGPRLLDDRPTCADPLSAVAWLRVAEAVVVLGSVVLLARRLGTTLRALGLVRPTRADAVIALLAIVVAPVPSLYLGAILAEPFFGPIQLDLSQPLAVVPALLLAVANGTMEEVAYRGALMSWMSRVTVPAVALFGQAIVFGAAHTGSDFVASPLPVVLAIVVGGSIAGIIVRRTGSLWLVIAVHIALDVPLYYAAACRLP
jgi:membrane protease YdiL (CAAX protease family)